MVRQAAPSFPVGAPVGEAPRAYADAIDAWLVAALADIEIPPGVALVAIGGSGRREMAPKSDLDLLLTYRKKEPKGLGEQIWYPIWDVGLKLGHSVRSVGDTLALARTDLDTATALLDARVILGDRDLGDELMTKAREQWRRQRTTWLPKLGASMDERHVRFGDVTFTLEPDMKNGRGGLRDAQSLRWAELAGAELPVPMRELRAPYEVLLGARVALHRAAGRAVERLNVDLRDDVADLAGFADTDAMMRAISAAGRSIAWSGDELFYDLSPGPALDLGADPVVEAAGRRIRVRTGVTPDAAVALHVGAVAAAHGARIDIASLEALAAVAPPTRWSHPMRDDFVALLRAGRDAIPVFEAFDHVGIWVALIPEWAPAQNRPQHNPFHEFTVDRHLVETVAVAATLEVDRPDLLVLGALLHDIGKAYPGDHSVAGMDIAADVLERMGYPPDDIETVELLVRHHLLLPDTATRRDLDDPSTLARVAAVVGRVDRLELLEALSVADGRATGPTAWSDWKANLVHELAGRATELLRGAEGHELVALSPFGPELLDLVGSLDDAPGRTLVRGSGDRLQVLTPDRPGLFSRIAGAVALHGLDIRDARVGSVDDIAIEELVVESSFGIDVAWDKVCADVERAITGTLALRARLASRAAAYPLRTSPDALPVAVRIITDESPTSGIVEVVGPDQIGLLYRVTTALAEFDLDITRAMVTTIGTDIVDVFYVQATDDLELESDPVKNELRLALLHALNE